jgi:ribosomal protein L23
MHRGEVIIEPIVTEKSNLAREKGKYSFRVDARANKIQVMQAVRAQFGVHPVACNIIIVKRNGSATSPDTPRAGKKPLLPCGPVRSSRPSKEPEHGH